MNVPPTYCIAIGNEGFECGICGSLPGGPKTHGAIKKHYHDHHLGTRVFEPKPIKPRKLINHEHYIRRMEKKIAENAKRIETRVCYRQMYNYEDLPDIGVFGRPNSVLEIKQSTLKNAGRGVFAKVALKPFDYITFYDGEFIEEEIPDKEYLMEVDGGYIDGIRKEYVGCGLGSFINRPNKNQKKANCEFEEIEGRDGIPEVVVCVLTDINAGDELLAHYGHGYQIKKRRRYRK